MTKETFNDLSKIPRPTGRPRTITKETFIERAKAIHGELYDYSLAEFNGYGNYVTIICKEHGPFQVAAYDHARGAHCRKCSLKERSKKQLGVSTMRFGSEASYWKGDDAKYHAKHAWIKKQYGKPNYCEHCYTTEAKRFDWANISGEYERERDDWLRLCRKCHTKYDRYKTHCKHGHEFTPENTMIDRRGHRRCRTCERRRCRESAQRRKQRESLIK